MNNFTTCFSVAKDGRFANALFKISAVLGYSENHNTIPIFIDFWDVHTNCDYSIIFKNKLNYDPSIKFYIKNKYKEDQTKFNNIPYLENLDLQGYWQSYLYFPKRETILKYFEPCDDIVEYIQNKFNIYLKDEPISLHCRRGDYLKRINEYINLSLDYYKKGYDYFGKDRLYLIFSDDIEWCKNNFNFINNKIFIDNHRNSKGCSALFENTFKNAFLDIFLMSYCNDFIIANSTFSWWGAYLSQNPLKTVIIPSVWYGPKNSHIDTSGLYLPDYIKM